MSDYILAGIPCKKCLNGQVFWQWEPISSIYKIPPFKTIRVLKCVQCGFKQDIDKESLK